ncbi:MAG: transglutaminase domain-containing protein [Myxococcales bacterium]|nr:transglutaminase domain-containing protein [Myxococcales bacterium]
MTHSGRWLLAPWDALGAVLVLSFVGLLAWHLLARAPEGPAADALLLDPSTEVQLGDEWLGLYFRGDRVGLVHIHKSAREGSGYRYDLRTRLRLSAFGTQAPMDMRVGADLSPGLALEHFDFSVEAGPARLIGQGTVDDRTVRLRLSTGGEAFDKTLQLDQPPVLRAQLGPLLSRRALTPGARFSFTAFDPLSQSDQRIDVEVIGPDTVIVFGREVPAIHLRQTISGLVLDGWINGRGEMLRQELGLGLVAVRETREEARFGLLPTAGSEGANLIRATQVAVGGLPPSLRDVDRLALRVSGVDLSDFALADRRQQFADAVLSVAREPVGPGLSLPVTTGAPPESLASDALIQASHPRIRTTAKVAIGHARDTVTAARRLKDWVHHRLEQTAVPGVPSALETLDARVGDCNEHSTLFAALARSVGIPTRIVVGLVYADGRFGYHAWNEVLAADGWLSVDATWNQMPVDVGHLAMLRGGLSEQARLLPLMGRLQLTVVP